MGKTKFRPRLASHLLYTNRFSASVDWPPRLSARTRGCICSGLTPPLSETPAFTQFAPRCVRARLASFPVDLLCRSPFRYCWCTCAPTQACSNSYSFPVGAIPLRTHSESNTLCRYQRGLSPRCKRQRLAVRRPLSSSSKLKSQLQTTSTFHCSLCFCFHL